MTDNAVEVFIAVFDNESQAGTALKDFRSLHREGTIELVDAANANGGRDNISVLLAQANSGSRKKGLISRWLGQ